MNSKKDGAVPAGTDNSLRTHELLNIVPQPCVKRKSLRVSRDEAVAIGKAIAPSFDKILLSKCLNPAKYGIVPVEGIASKIFSESRRSDFRVLNNKLTVRCDDALYRRLQQAKKAFGADCTTQEFIMTAMLHECERIEGKREEAHAFTVRGS
jgi:hypothetical protein